MKLNKSSILTNILDLGFKNREQVKKLALIENSEEGAKQYLRLMGGVILANYNDRDFLSIAIKNDIKYIPYWLDDVFVYQPNPKEGEAIKLPQTIMREYKQTGKIIGDCKIAAIFVGTLLKNYERLNKIEAVYICQVLNPTKEEKHVVAGYKQGTQLILIDPTTPYQIDKNRISLLMKL